MIEKHQNKEQSGRKREFAKLSAGITHYELRGPDCAKVVVLIHGGTIPLWAWNFQVDALGNAGFRVLRYDQFGRGMSDKPKRRYNRFFYRLQLLELLNTLGLNEPVHLAGHSFGACIAADFAAHYPQRTARMVLVSPFFNLAHYNTPFKQVVRFLKIPLLGLLFMKLVVLPSSIKRAKTLIYNSCLDSNYENMFIRQASQKGFERSLFSLLRSDFVGPYEDTFRFISKRIEKILLIWGDKDDNTPEALIKDVRSWLPKARYHEFKDVGHQPNWQVKDEFNHLLVDFLKGN